MAVAPSRRGHVAHRWGGPFSVTVDLIPAIGYVGDHCTAVYSLGCIGHGVAMSYLNGKVLTELLLDGDSSLVGDCPFVNRRVIPCRTFSPAPSSTLCVGTWPLRTPSTKPCCPGSGQHTRGPDDRLHEAWAAPDFDVGEMDPVVMG